MKNNIVRLCKAWFMVSVRAKHQNTTSILIFGCL